MITLGCWSSPTSLTPGCSSLITSGCWSSPTSLTLGCFKPTEPNHPGAFELSHPGVGARRPYSLRGGFKPTELNHPGVLKPAQPPGVRTHRIQSLRCLRINLPPGVWTHRAHSPRGFEPAHPENFQIDSPGGIQDSSLKASFQMKPSVCFMHYNVLLNVV